MEHTVLINMLFSMIITIMVVILGFVTAFVLAKRLSNSGNLWITITPFLVLVTVCLSFLVLYGEGLIYPAGYFLHGGEAEEMSIGKVEEVQPGPEIPVYFDPVSSGVCRGTYIIMDGCQYFLAGNSIQVGQWVKVEYISQDRIICSWNTLSEAYGKSSEVYGFPIFQETFEDAGQQDHTIAYILWYSSFALFLLIVLFQHIWGSQIGALFQSLDARYTDGIYPSNLGILFYCNFIPLYGMIASWWLYGYQAAGFMLIVCGSISLAFVFSKRTTYAVLSGDILIIGKWKRRYAYGVTQIQTVKWRTTNLAFGRRLDITFSDGSMFSFEQELFWGLTNMYKQLNHATKKDKQLENGILLMK